MDKVQKYNSFKTYCRYHVHIFTHVSVHHSNFQTNLWILLKLRISIMPLEAALPLYFKFPAISNTNIVTVLSSEVGDISAT
jgi:hypothetical protein